MAFTSFYLSAGLSGASDVNAGSTTTGAAAYTSTSGNWSTVTNQFTPTDGSTPANSIAIGDYVSIYVNAASVTTFVAQVTLVAAGVNGAITVDATIRYGTAPTTNSGARSLKAGGTWNSEIVLAATGLGTTTVPQSTKINIKTATITLSANRTITMAGSATAPLWFSGYNANPGDLDNDTTNGLAGPTFSLGSNTLSCSGQYQFWSSCYFSGNRNGNTVFHGNGNNTQRWVRCRFTNTNVGSATQILAQAAGTYLACYFSVPTSATGADIVNSSSSLYIGCTFAGGGRYQVAPGASGNMQFSECVFLDGAGGLSYTTGSVRVEHCTFSNLTGDGINWSGAPGAASMPNVVRSCLFRALGGYGINNASGTNAALVTLACNDFYSCTQGATNGFGDTPLLFNQTDSSDPVTSASNMTPVATSNAKYNGFPGIFENETFNSYAWIGAVQPIQAGGYAGGVYGA